MSQVRSWIPWSLLVVLTAPAAMSAVVGATTDRGEPTHRDLLSPFYSRAGTLKTIPTSASTTLPPQAGYRGIENFCAVAPLAGTNDPLRRDKPQARRRSHGAVGGLPPNDQVFVNWSNNYVRAPVIADFQTDSSGAAIQSSVGVGRLAEVRGVEIVLSAASVPNPSWGASNPASEAWAQAAHIDSSRIAWWVTPFAGYRMANESSSECTVVSPKEAELRCGLPQKLRSASVVSSNP